VKNLLDLIFRTVIYVCRLLFLYKTKREPVCCLYVCDFSDITHKKKTSPSSSHLAELFVVYSPWIMENSRNSVLRFLYEQEKLAEDRIKQLNLILDADESSIPQNTIETFFLLRHNAEDDLSNLQHIQHCYSGQSRSQSVSMPVQDSQFNEKTFEGVPPLNRREPPMTDNDDLFGFDDIHSSDPINFSHSGVEHHDDEVDVHDEDTDLDEGIHIPGKLRPSRHNVAVAASLPVGIPWPANSMAQAPPIRTNRAGAKESNKNPSDIAASIQALAMSVYDGGIFGELPRPRVNTFSKD